MRWYERNRLEKRTDKRTDKHQGSLKGSLTSSSSSSSRAPVGAPVVAILLYRKHVITQQGYIAQMITTFEQQGLIPLPIFINGVEAHTIVRDLLTTRYALIHTFHTMSYI
jgi:magnesium chelatase subunit H